MCVYVHRIVLSFSHKKDRTGRTAKCSGVCVYVHGTVLSVPHGKDRTGKIEPIAVVHVWNSTGRSCLSGRTTDLQREEVKKLMIFQPTVFVKEFSDVRVSSLVILVYGVTIRWLHFALAQSICTRPLDQKEVWPGDKASPNQYGKDRTMKGNRYTVINPRHACARGLR